MTVQMELDHSAVAVTVERPVLPADHILYDNDILTIIFSFLDPDDCEDRVTCANSAIVCHAWTEPASRVLWRRMDWWLLPLYNILIPTPKVTPFDPDAEEQIALYRERIMQERPYDDPIKWARFLCCGARVQEADLALVSDTEVELIALLLERNNGETFLPCIKFMHWAPLTQRCDESGLLLALLPPFLQELNLAFAPDTAIERKEHFVADLTSVIPYLHALVIDIWSPYILKFTHLRDFRLYDLSTTTINTAQLRQLVSMPSLKTTYIAIEGLDSLPYNETIDAPALEELRCKGSCADLTGLVQRLRAPNLRELIFYCGGECSTYAPAHEHLFRTLCTLPIARSLTSMGFFMANTPIVTPGSTLPKDSLIDMLEPFLVLGHLQSFKVVVSSAISCTDEDILRIARAWPKIRHLTLAFTPGEVLPSPAALSHVVEHCRELRTLAMEIDHDPQAVRDLLATASAPSSASNSPSTTTVRSPGNSNHPRGAIAIM